ncbi:MAG: endonuclease/exonuclease/phosphatase family protein [Austwickia sp.]|nr:MAG: endonuclease/exonuclease/phosphatase family protein [Austwickia sp.]
MATDLGVLALNLAAPTPAAARGLLEYLWARDEQVLVLSEVSRGEGSRLVLEVCRAAGYVVAVAPMQGRDRGVAVVVRDPGLSVGAAAYPSGPRVVRVPAGPVVVIGVYGAASDPVRYSSAAQRERKRAWLRDFVGLAEAAAADPGPLLVAGDLNIVDPDDREGLPYVLLEERDAYERLIAAGLVDAYRVAALGGGGAGGSSGTRGSPRTVGNPGTGGCPGTGGIPSTGGSHVTWVDHSGVGCRYDHALGRGLDVLAAQIDHHPREQGLTDHSALAVWLRAH